MSINVMRIFESQGDSILMTLNYTQKIDQKLLERYMKKINIYRTEKYSSDTLLKLFREEGEQEIGGGGGWWNNSK